MAATSSDRLKRIDAARAKARAALDEADVEAVLRAAAGSKSVDKEASAALKAAAEEVLARVAEEAVYAAEERNESTVSASSVAVAASRSLAYRSL
ncbi:MAG: hypothetical protein ACP5RP_04040 [Candidatus Micrarchaeia archaeon]